MKIAAPAAASLRKGLEPILPFPKDRTMQCRFAGALMKWLGTESIEDLLPQTSIPFITGFSFNDLSSIAERWKLSFAISQVSPTVLQLRIPAFVPKEVIAAPAYTVSITCSISATSCWLNDSMEHGSYHIKFDIPYDNSVIPEQVIDLLIPAAQGTLSITAMSFVYHLSTGRPVSNKAFMPSAVIDARYY